MGPKGWISSVGERPSAPREAHLRLGRWPGRLATAATLLALAIVLPYPVAPRVESPPFRLPFADPPGPDTWLLAQPYGNTVFAYRARSATYWAGQGIHFGIDLDAACGTTVLAIGAGTVVAVDNPYHGAGPHNLIIDHPNGYGSLYGHLRQRSHLRIGDKVRAGDPIGVVGDPDLTCASRPHLHLEIRSAPRHDHAYNPMALIEADWERIALAGGWPQAFQIDAGQPTRWTDMVDQPTIKFGQPLLNNYAKTWPPDW
jgi:murein DD-endopeptidase MepM/ murein hydrolase activator NlpD